MIPAERQNDTPLHYAMILPNQTPGRRGGKRRDGQVTGGPRVAHTDHRQMHGRAAITVALLVDVDRILG